MRRRTTHSGFTLLELLLAMAVTCMLALSLFTSMRTAFKARDSANAAVEPVRAVSIGLEMAGHDLESALPPKGILAGPFYGVAMGTPGAEGGDMVEFYAVGGGIDSNDPTRADGVRRIQVTLERMPDGTGALVRRVQRNLLAMQESPPEYEVLCRNVAAFEVTYFDGTTWAESWDSTAMTDTLPLAVQMTVQLAPDPNRPNVPGYHLTRTFALPCAQTQEAAQSQQ
jgi:type II secretion system protein J